MIKVKLTDLGGYVIGDGDCPFNPDDFIKAFGKKIMAAKMQGMSEVGFSDEEIAAAIARTNAEIDKTFDDAPVLELPDGTRQEQLLALA
jgi:hypothetical protein